MNKDHDNIGGEGDAEVYHYTVGANPTADILFDAADALIVTGERPSLVLLMVSKDGKGSSIQWEGDPYALLYALKHAADLVAYEIAKQPAADAEFRKLVMGSIPKN